MSLGRNVKEFDIVYVEALRAAYPDATVDEIAEYTSRSRSTVKKILDGGYSGLRGHESSPEAVSEQGGGQLSIDFDSALKTQMRAFERKLEAMEARLVALEPGEEGQ